MPLQITLKNSKDLQKNCLNDILKLCKSNVEETTPKNRRLKDEFNTKNVKRNGIDRGTGRNNY